MAVGGTVDASETGMPLLCTKDDEEESNQASSAFFPLIIERR
jgi:hypothetical protein